MSVADLLVMSINLGAACAVAAFCIRRDRALMPAVRLAAVLGEPLNGLPVQN